MSQYQSRWIIVGIIILISLIGAGVLFFATRWGPWAYSDGAGYIVNARNLLRGDGMGLWRASGRFVLTSHHPPLYILALASLGMFGVDPLTTARCLSVLLFASTILVMGLSTFAITKNGLLAISLSGVTLSFPILIELYSGVMSEGLFFLLGFSALMTTILSVQKGDIKVVAAAGILSGLAFLTRYIGVGFVITCALVSFIFSPLPFMRRLRHAILITSLGVLPVVLWLIWLGFQPTAEPARLVNFEIGNLWINLQPVRVALVDSLWRFLPFIRALPDFSYRLSLLMLLGIFIFLSTCLMYAWIRRNEQEFFEEGKALLNITLLLFSVVYILGLVFSYLFTLPTPDFSLRTLSPALFAFTLSFVIFSFYAASLRQQTRWLAVIPLLFAVSIMISHYPESRDKVLSLSREGRGFTSLAWQTSPTIEAIQDINNDVPLITNESVAILLYTNRSAYDFPPMFAEQAAAMDTRFGDDKSDAASTVFREDGAALVLFDSIFGQLEPLDHDRAKAKIEALIEGLDIFFESTDGAIYFYPDNENSNG
jgi:4-amino-4-deoxy-L-arabinose transferase-like glycosyltransferase